MVEPEYRLIRQREEGEATEATETIDATERPPNIVNILTQNEEITLKRIENELVILKELEKKHVLDFKAETRKLSVIFNILGVEIPANIDLSNKYPFYPPKVDITPIKEGGECLFKLGHVELTTILNEDWTPSINLAHIVSSIYTFLLRTITIHNGQEIIKSRPHFLILAVQHMQNSGYILPIILLISTIFRVLVGFSGHSGIHNPPKYGDYEVHRHWFEITSNLDTDEWYSPTKNNDYNYWALDYPPLCAYLHYILGNILQIIYPESVALFTSRGFESTSLKIFMRGSVMLIDLLILASGLIALLRYIYRKIEDKYINSFILLAFNIPLLLLIDHGHFQYNCAMMGFTTWAMYFLIDKQIVMATIAFCLGLNFKQMNLYYALAFLAYVIAITWYDSKNSTSPLSMSNTPVSTFLKQMFRFSYLISKGMIYALVAIFTTIFIWLPWIKDLDFNLTGDVVARIFPVWRGLFEDKVANLWCFLNMIFKLRLIFSQEALLLITTLVTFTAAGINGVILLKKATIRNFMICIFNISLSFFLFSYQVHEKSILIPLLPFACMIGTYGKYYSILMITGLFSNYDLLKRDKCSTAYFMTMIISGYIITTFQMHMERVLRSISRNTVREGRNHNYPNVNKYPRGLVDRCINIARRMDTFALIATSLFMFLFHLVELFLGPPARYPHIYLLINTYFSFGIFIFIYFFSLLLLIQGVRETDSFDDIIFTNTLSIFKKKGA